MAVMTNEERQAQVKEIAENSDEKARNRAIFELASKSGGNFTQENQRLSEEVKAYQAKHEDVGPSLNVTQFNTPVGGLQVQGGAAFDQNGKFAGSSTSVQTGVMDNAYGAAAVGVATAQNADGKLTTVAPYAKYVGPAFGTEASSPVAGVPIAAVTANIPMNGNLEAKNVDMTAGVAAWHKETGISSITTVTTDAAGSKAVVGQNFSGNVYSGEDVKVALNAGVSHDFVGDKTGVSGGVLVRGDVNENVQLYAGANVGVNDIGGANDVGVGVQLGANFDFNDKSAASAQKAQAPEQATQQAADAAVQNMASSISLTPRAQQQTLAANDASAPAAPNMQTDHDVNGRNHTTIQPHAQQSQNADAAHDLSGFLNMSHKQQVALVGRMTENYVNTHPGVDRDEAQQMVVHALLNPQQTQTQTSAAELTHG